MRHELPFAEPPALTDRVPAGKVQTSVDAFERVDGAPRRRQQERVLDFITYRGHEGATSHEICDALRLGPQVVSARLNDLSRAGLAIRDGRRRKNERGSSAYVWVATSTRTGAGK